MVLEENKRHKLNGTEINEEKVVSMADERRIRLDIIEARRGKMIGHLIRYYNLFTRYSKARKAPGEATWIK